MEFIVNQLRVDGLLIALAIVVTMFVGSIAFSLAKIANK